MRKKTLPILTLFLAAIFVLTSCPNPPNINPDPTTPGEEEGEKNPVTGIVVRQGESAITEGKVIYIDENEEITLTVRLYPTDVEAAVTWTQGSADVQVSPAADGLSAGVKGLGAGGSLAITVSASNADNTEAVTRTFTVSVRVSANTRFTVSFNANAGADTVNNMPAAITELASGAKINRPAAPQRDGHSFAGWFKEEECVNLWIFGSDTVSKNTTLYAKWTEPLPHGEAKFVYYWLDENDTIATAGASLALTESDSVTFTAASGGYTVIGCFINGIAETGFSSDSYTFSAAGWPSGTHTVEVTLLIEKGGKYYSAEFNLTVTN